uniref:Uncharacterized protein n=1 Tax=Entomoneis paludosa TaxID=265537 RepID=A0A7S3DV48_9STRA|mmetsp:Transcript_39304/g.81584  ORF Transcript_39304/g.81584 Transcript_39304/m.81584 type:complete len:324 (+) Transcript_39304:122-1093(+)|eukprot:CAMPEP_0172454922 /NCGR_PEP_ID=MMETSP1065-20121228/11762_1 /TAXON_ID=265537 /ORGANISM="Amphiprora paludosa, Strain CCMP125" /LENGTH=323 /DNA_ID=CAMNT_0013207333 /DNA_START=93 /DNA_END=1064 /DNA_ORIENTATION=-
MSNINSETGEYTANEGRSPRFTSWVFFLICSVITLKASVEVRNDMEDPNGASKWAVTCSAITFSVTALVALVHLAPVYSSLIIGSKIEGLIILIMTGFWAATVSIVSNTNNDLGAVKSDTNQVSNGNLYYFSWAGFVTAIQLLVSYLKSSFGIDLMDEVSGRGARLMYWAGLLTAAIVVLGSSARVMNEDCTSEHEGDFPSSYCARTKLGVGLGSVGFAFSIIVVGMKLVRSTPPFTVEFALASLLTVLNAFGVAYITSNSGPGRAIGNLYYSSWISFLLSAYLAVDCFNASKGAGADDNVEQGKASEADIPVGDLDDEEANR